jgi:O6-methylguanine-DNA--protein-cysteine methyltransferase
MPGLKYGYDMLPGHIELDRDRNKVSQFNLTWETSKMWAEMDNRECAAKINEMIKAESIDVEYYQTHSRNYSEIYKDVCELQYGEFIKAYGKNAVLCKDENEASVIRAKYGNLVPIIVPEKKYVYIGGSASYQSMTIEHQLSITPAGWVEAWLKRTEVIMLEERAEIIEESKKWRYV